VAPGAPCTDNAQCPAAETCLGDELAPSTAGTCGRSDRIDDSCDGFCFGLSCAQPIEAELGACVPLAGKGESCAELPCPLSLRCDDEQRCVERGGVGAPCTGSPECRESLFCDVDLTGEVTGQCVQPQEPGAPCVDADDCASFICGPTSMECEDFPGCYP
jgi:hypothetical protein